MLLNQVILAVAAIFAVWLGLALLGTARRKNRLRKLFSRRDATMALASCVEAFPGIERDRVARAYAWVQQLVDDPAAPIRADDDLSRDLGIDQGEADDRFEASRAWRGESGNPPPTALAESPVTVRDLMAEVLAHGYEGYPDGTLNATCETHDV